MDARLPSRGPSRHRVLVVDDNHDAALSLALVLEVLGNETRAAHDGLEAVRACEEFRPDLVLLDLGLPRLDGHGAARAIREQPWGRDVVLIALTGRDDAADVRRSREAGFDEHLVKPVEPARLERLLREHPPGAGASPAPAP